MNRRFLAQATNTLPRIAQELLALSLDGPHEVIVRPLQKRISDDKRAVLHILLRSLADHLGYTVGGLKAVMAQDGDWPIETLTWRGKERRVRKETMSLTDAECRDLIAVVEGYCIEYGVEMGRRDNWQDEVA